MIVGSVPILAVARMRARGFSPCASPNAFEPTSTPAAPSTMPLELPAWWTWLIRSRCGYFISATLSKPGITSPISLNAGFSAPSACMSVPGRMYSSVARIGRPLTSRTVRIERAKRSVVPGGLGAALAFHRQRVAIVAGKPVFGGDDVGRDALRHEIGLHRHATGRRRSRRRPSPSAPGPSSRPRRRYRPRRRRRGSGWRQGSPPPAPRRRSG